MPSVPKIVVKRLQSPAADPHPDADLLTAFAERSLTAPERDRIIHHLARCGDCREVVSRALPPQIESQALPDSSANWFRWTLLRGSAVRWATLAAGVALIVSLGILQTRHQRTRELAVNVFDGKQATTTPAPSSRSSSQMAVPQNRMQKDEPAVLHARTALDEKKSEKKSEKESAQPQGTISQPRANPAVATAGSLGGTAIGSGVSGTLNVKPHLDFALASTPQNPRPAAAARQNPVAAQQTAVIAGSSQTVEVQTENAQIATEPAAPREIEGQLIQNEPSDQSPASADRVGKAKPALVQASPALAPAPALNTDPTLMKGGAAIHWTISAGGVLQRSIDGGRTWLDVNVATDSMRDRGAKTKMATVTAQAELSSKAQPESQSEARNQAKFKNDEKQPAPAAPVIFRALSVSSNAGEVWAGGSGGALFHTLDGGNTWTRVVPSATGIFLTGDILSVQFSPGNGTVATSTAEIWTTPDDGQTWHKQQ
jgi:hypothetical protein